jgi:hypothetical protein
MSDVVAAPFDMSNVLRVRTVVTCLARGAPTFFTMPFWVSDMFKHRQC